MRVVTTRKFETDGGTLFDDREEAAKAEFVERLRPLVRTASLGQAQETAVLKALAEGVDEIDAAVEQFHSDAGR